MNEGLEHLVRALPKAELHLHLEGAMSPTLAIRLAERHGLALPGSERGVEGLREAFVFRTFEDFIRLYLRISATLSSAADFRDLVLDVSERLAAQNVRYAEVTFTPMTHVARGVARGEVVAGLSEGRAEALARHAVYLRWVFDVVRSFPDQARPTWEFARSVEAYDPGAVAGLGVGGPERGVFDMGPIIDMFAAGRAAGLRSLPHAGEMAGPESIWLAIDQLGADRLGHGVRCLEDPRLVDTLRDRRIPLEVCPTSNVLLGVVPTLAEHPLPRLLAEGLIVTLGSDDPTFFATDLVREFVTCAVTFGWSAMDVRALVAASLEASFMPAAWAESMSCAASVAQ